MILAQVSGSSVGAYVLVDIELPHWAVHEGRKAIRRVAEDANQARATGAGWGWKRLNLNMLPGEALQVSVRETGNAKLNVWPIDRAEMPREWTGRDEMWRDVMRDLFVPALNGIGVEAHVEFMPGGSPIVRTETDRLLQSVPIFIAGKPRYRRRAESRKLVAA